MNPLSIFAAVGLLAAGAQALAAPAAGDARADLRNGRDVFLARCVLCHGPEADGNGQMAKLLNPPPANLQRSVLTEAQRNDIVRHGGAAVGRSSAMPRWELELDEQQLRDVLAFVADVSARGPNARTAP